MPRATARLISSSSTSIPHVNHCALNGHGQPTGYAITGRARLAHADPFVPKQFGWAPDLGPVRSSPALMVGSFAAPRLHFSRRQSATTARTPTDNARVCLVAPPLASTTLPMPSTRQATTAGPVTTVPELSA